MTKFTHRCRQTLPLVASIVGLALTIVIVWFYLLKPWPGVESSNEWTLVDPPADGVYEVHDILTWTKPKVCTPAGNTTVQFLATREIPPGAFDYLLYTRILRYPVEDCNTPNVTRILIPNQLSTGTYRITINACTDTPNPRDTCNVFEGPLIKVYNPSF